MMVAKATRLEPLCVLPFLLFAAPSHAQQASLAVNVVSQEGSAPLADAEVTLENRAIGVTQKARTDSTGRAHFAGLSTSGQYVVSVGDGETHGAVRSEALSLRSNFVRSVTLVAPVRATTVLVQGVRIVSELNQVNAEVSATLGQDELEQLPVEGRDVLRALVHLPNVVPSTGFFPEAPAISINGANGLYVNYL